jgi:phosphoenolpyruvate synthase/pyruvate phosphate dikinase
MRVYRTILKSFAPRPVIMRTLDVGGDKPLPYYPMREESPFLGWRGIRFTLDRAEGLSFRYPGVAARNSRTFASAGPITRSPRSAISCSGEV